MPIRLRRMASIAVAPAELAQVYVRSSIEGSCVSFSESSRLVLLPTRRSEIPEGQGPGAENHLLPRMRRPPYSLWGDRDGEIAIDDQADSGDEYLLWVDEKGNALRAVADGRPERNEDGYGTDRQIATERAEWFHPEGIGATRMTEPRRVWRFLPSGMSTCRNLRSRAAGWVRPRRRRNLARLGANALRQRSGVQARRQARCDDSVPMHRHGRTTQYGAAPTRIPAAVRGPSLRWAVC